MASTATALNILVTASTAQAQAKLSAVDAQMKKMAATSGASGASLSKMNKGLLVGAGGMAALGGAAVIAGKQLYDLGKEFDSAYDKIRVGTGATGKELDKLKASFKDVAKNVPNDFEEVGEAVADLNTRLGLSGKPLEAMAENMLHLSNITGDDLRGNIKSVARAFVDWEVPVRKQTDALDGLFRLSQASGASVSEIADNIQKFGSPLRTLGWNIDEAAAMFANFERAGVNMQTMVPGLRFAIGNLVDPTAELQQKMKGLGIEAGKPEEALRRVMDLIGNKSRLKDTEKITLAMEVFGKRAGADMKEAIKQGRFEVEDFMNAFNGKKGDSIRKAADDTYDFSENAKTLGNRLKVLVEPAASGLFDTLGELSGALVEITEQTSKKGGRGGKGGVDGWLDRFSKKGEDAAAAADLIRAALWGVGGAMKIAAKVVSERAGYIKDRLRGVWSAVKGGVQIVTGLFRGDWGGALKGAGNVVQGLWGVVKAVFKHMTAGIRASVKQTDWILRNTFGGTWKKVKDIFRDGADAVASIVKGIIQVINLIPGVPDINIGGATTSHLTPSSRRSNIERRQRGGALYGGKPSGDSIPAMLERGEYVLNRKAVQKVGVQNLDKFNFGAAPRFQEGGPVGLISGGDAWNAAKGAVGKIVGKGAGFFIDKLPKPNIPEPFTGFGPWVIEQVKNWIKGKVKGPGDPGGPLGGMSGSLNAAMNLARSHGLTITSTTGGTHAPGSYHYSGRAFDASNGSSPTPQMMSYFGAAAGKYGRNLAELFYDPAGWYIKHGNKVPGAIGGHSDHVHTAMQSGGVVKKAANILTRRGFDHKAIAGILGNAYGESNWNPAAMEPGTDNGGLFGFTAGEKSLASLRAFAAKEGKPWTDVGTQVRFMLRTGGAGLKGRLNALDSIEATTKLFMDEYERPGIPRFDTRVSGGFKASKYLRGIKFGSGGGGGDSAPEPIRLTSKQRKARRAAQRAATAALRYAKAVRAEAKNGKLAKRGVNAAKRAAAFIKAGDFEKANRWTRRAQSLAGRAAATIPGLRGKRPGLATNQFDSSDPFSVRNLPGFNRLPKSVRSLLLAPGLGWAGRRDVAGMALDAAGQTATKLDDAAALNVILGLERGRRRKAQARFRKANTVLARGGLTKAQRSRWLKVRNASLDTITQSSGEIRSANQSVRELNQTDEANTTDLAAAMKELADAIAAQTAMQSSVQATGSREALRMLSDVISGEIVGKRAGVPAQTGVRY